MFHFTPYSYIKHTVRKQEKKRKFKIQKTYSEETGKEKKNRSVCILMKKRKTLNICIMYELLTALFHIHWICFAVYSLHDHMTVVHRSQHGLDITYPCSLCVQRFHSLDALAKHKGIVHSHQRSSGIDAAFCNRWPST